MQAALEKLRQNKFCDPTYFEVLTALSGEIIDVYDRNHGRPGAWSRRPGRIRPEACGGNEGRPATILN